MSGVNEMINTQDFTTAEMSYVVGSTESLEGI